MNISNFILQINFFSVICTTSHHLNGYLVDIKQIFGSSSFFLSTFVLEIRCTFDSYLPGGEKLYFFKMACSFLCSLALLQWASENVSLLNGFNNSIQNDFQSKITFDLELNENFEMSMDLSTPLPADAVLDIFSFCNSVSISRIFPSLSVEGFSPLFANPNPQ